jgi:hypothetical protein
MIASPTDVEAERARVRAVLAEWNAVNSAKHRIVLLPVSWETHSAPTMGEPPQAIINKQVLKCCDLLVGVFWTRCGTPTDDYASGTIEEVEEHIKSSKPTMLYFSSAPVHPDSVDPAQYARLKDFKKTCQGRGLLQEYDSLSDFSAKFSRQLQIKLNQDAYFKTVEPTGNSEEPVQSRSRAIPPLSDEAALLLTEAAADPQGIIMRLEHVGGTVIGTSSKEMSGDDPRSEAVWEAAIDELVQKELIKDKGYKRELFALTRRGYEVADLFKK